MQERPAVFGGKDRMQEKMSKGLAHVMQQHHVILLLSMRIQPIPSSWWCTAPVPQTYLDIGRPREEHATTACTTARTTISRTFQSGPSRSRESGLTINRSTVLNVFETGQ